MSYEMNDMHFNFFGNNEAYPPVELFNSSPISASQILVKSEPEAAVFDDLEGNFEELLNISKYRDITLKDNLAESERGRIILSDPPQTLKKRGRQKKPVACSKKCIVLNCENTVKDTILFKFPDKDKNPAQYEQWVEGSGHTYEYLERWKTLKMCMIHFDNISRDKVPRPYGEMNSSGPIFLKLYKKEIKSKKCL